MPSTLLFFPDSTDPDMTWIRLEEGAIAASGHLSESAPAIEPDAAAEPRTVLVVPAEATLRTAVQVPARQRRQMLAALPFVIEEHLAEDVETLHLAAGGRDAEGAVAVAAIRPERLRSWLETLQAAGFEADSALVDADLVPRDPGEIGVLVGSARVLIAGPDGTRVGGERELLTPLLAGMATSGQGEGAALRITRTDDVAADALDLAQLPGLLTGSGERDLVDVDAGASLQACLAEAIEQRADDGAVELLQGAFTPPRRALTPGWQRWRGVLALAAGWFALALAVDLIQIQWLDGRAASLDRAAQEAFVQILPDRTRSPNPRRELAALLGADSGDGDGADFMTLLAVVGGELGANPGADGRITSLSYNAARGDLALEMLLPRIDAVDALKAALEARGLAAEIDSAVQEQGRVRARIRVRGGQA